ncbi:MAG: SDR family oxidoreductase [Acidimicrobiales bacterium]|nr:SDR family oxidoreductase [Acidimicrobiales bacterium]
MSDRLQGRVAIVTGAGQGIGRGVALALAGEGARVALVGRTEAKVQAVAEEVGQRGGSAWAIHCDVSDRAQVDRMVQEVIEQAGQLDILVNNAQAFTFVSLEDCTVEDLDLLYRSGVLGTFHCSQAALPHLKERGGSIINFGTSSALTADPTFGPYAMAKEAIRAMTKVAASEWGPHGIRVNAVCPTALSPAFQAYADANPEAAAAMASARPLGRMGDPELDIGRAVVAIASDDLRYLTGATLMLNGGRVYL